MRSLFAFAVVSALSMTQLGCIKSMLVNGQISSTRTAAGAFDSIADWELARSAASAGLVQFEGLHKLAPDNEDGLFLLVKSWVGYGFAFPEDEYEAAVVAENNALAEYHKGRAQHAYDRALFYGLELLNRRADGFEAASRELPALKAWLANNFTSPEDAEILFWVANAWLARVNIAKEDPEQVAKLWVGVELMERSVAIDPTYMGWGGTSTLASFHARSGMAELDQAKAMFETAIAKTNRKALLPIMNYGSRYGCVKNDRALYEKLLKEVVGAGDVDPNNRLQNMLAKRRAARYLTKSWMLNECGFE